MQNTGSSKGARRSAPPAAPTPTRCSLLFAYCLDEKKVPFIWELCFVNDREYGPRVETFIRDGSSLAFYPARPDGDRIAGVYKVQIQDDSLNTCPAIHDSAGGCLFLAETVVRRHSLTLDLTPLRGVAHIGVYQSFNAKFLIAMPITTEGRLTWRLEAEVDKARGYVAWKEFSFTRVDESSKKVSFIDKALGADNRRLANSLRKPNTLDPTYAERQLEIPLNKSKSSLSHLRHHLENFPVRNDVLTEGISLGLALRAVPGSDGFSIFARTLAYRGELDKASVYDYLAFLKRDKLTELGYADATKLGLSWEPSWFLQSGPSTSGNSQFTDYRSEYIPTRKSVLQIHALPSWTFTKIWNRCAQPLLDDLKRVDAGNPASFLPRFHEFDPGSNSRFWTQALLAVDSSEGESAEDYETQKDEKSRSHLELYSLRAGRMEAGLEGEKFTLELPNLSSVAGGGGIGSLQVEIASPKLGDFDVGAPGIRFAFQTPIYGVPPDAQAPEGSPNFQVRMGSFDITIQRTAPESTADRRASVVFDRDGRPFIDCNVALAISDCSPGGQDHAPADEFAPPNSAAYALKESSRCESGVRVHPGTDAEEDKAVGRGAFYEAMFESESPVTIFIPPKNRSGNYTLKADEYFHDQRSHTLDLYLFNKRPLGVATPASIFATTRIWIR